MFCETMAIVFSPQRGNQRVFIGGTIVVLILLALAIFLIIFLPDFLGKPGTISNPPLSGSQNITLNLGIIDLPQVKNLEPFSGLETKFTYTVLDKDGKQIIGTIVAPSKERAQSILEGAGFKVVSFSVMNVGRSEPFASY